LSNICLHACRRVRRDRLPYRSLMSTSTRARKVAEPGKAAHLAAHWTNVALTGRVAAFQE
jgi:hypothetical protein